MPDNGLATGPRRVAREGARSPLARCVVAAMVLAAAVAPGDTRAMGNKRSPGKLEQGAFTPTRAVAKQYGPDPEFSCPSGGAVDAFADEIAKRAKSAGKSPPQSDGRLCAVADTLLGWQEATPPTTALMKVLAQDFGLVTPVSRVFVSTVESEDQQQIADRLEEAVRPYVERTDGLRYALVTQRVRKGATKLVLVMTDPLVDVEGVPRRVPPASTVTVTARPLVDASGLQLVACDPDGKLTTVELRPPALRGEIACGARPGVMYLEIRGQVHGALSAMGSFPVGCGVDLPVSAPVAPAAKATADPAAAAHAVLDGVNALRAAAQRPPLQWDDAVATVAKADAERLRAASSGQTVAPVDIVASLKQAGISSPLVLENPAAGKSVDEAATLIASSPVSRSNLLNPAATHGGVGVAVETRPDTGAIYYVSELLVLELPPADPAAVRAKLLSAIELRRADARATPAVADAKLDEVAQKYASELATHHGTIPKDLESALLAPLYKAYRTVNIMSGVKADPLDFAEEPGIVGEAKFLAVGVATGTSATLGKNSVFVVIVTATPATAAPHHKK